MPWTLVDGHVSDQYGTGAYDRSGLFPGDNNAEFGR